MATNRYGQIYHGDHHHINVRFPSTEARLKFQNEFEAYHASHDHEGDVPIFKNVASKDLKLSTGSRSPEDFIKAETDKDYSITIDGYGWNDIHEYHNPRGFSRYFWYHVPTCCVPPIIVIDREFVDSGTLQRHPLSAIFGDMPADDFQSLLESVERDGFIDPIVRIHEGQILDGWHRYRAAQELNLIRGLKFQEWREDEKKDGDPKAFVLARNIERRHLTPGQRAQIAVTFNERFGQGNIKAQREDSGSSNDEPKTREQLAQEVSVSTATIDRAIAVEKEGKSETVISGEKTAGEVLKEQKQARLTEARINANKSLEKVWETFHESELTKQIEPDDFVKGACAHHKNWGVDDIPEMEETDIPEIWEARFNLLTTQIQTRSSWIQEFVKDPGGTLKEREVSKLRKQKKQSVKSLWDTRIQVARDYTGDSDTDLNLNLTLPELEKGFAEHNPTYADAFESAMKRTSETSFNIVLEKVLASDIDVETLQTEYRALMTYAGDVRNWERADWSPDTNWILPLIEAKTFQSVAETDDEPDTERLRAQQRADDRRRRMWSYFSSEIRVKAEKTTKEVSEEDFAKAAATALGLGTIRVVKVSHEEDGLSGLEYCFGADKFILGDIKSPPYSLSDCTLADAAMWANRFDLIAIALMNMADWVKALLEEPDYEQLQQGHVKRLNALPGEIKDYIPKWVEKYEIRDNFQGRDTRKITLKLLLNARCQIEFGRERGPDAFFREEMEDLLERMQLNDVALIEKVLELLDSDTAEPDAPDMNALWSAFNKRYPKWKAKYAESGYKENDLIQASTEAEMLDALRVYRESDRKGMPTADEVKDMTDLMKQQSYPFARCLRNLLRAKGTSDAENTDDTSLNDLNLPSLKEGLDTMLETIGQLSHTDMRDDMSVAVFEALYGEYEDVTNRECLSILIDCAHSIVAEDS